MKTIKPILFALMAIPAIFTGCNQDTELDNGDRVALRVNSNISVDTQVRKSLSRAVDGSWEPTDAIGIFALKSGSVDTYANNQYTIADAALGTFSPAAEDQTIYLPVDGSTRDFVAYYPHNAAMTATDYTINLTDQTSQSAIDFMVSERTDGTDSKVTGISKTDPNVQFRFHHKLAKLRLSIKTGNGFTGDDSELTNLKVDITGQPATGTFDILTSDAVTTSDADQTITLLTTTTGTSAEGIVFPSADYQGMQFVFTIDGHTYSWDIADSQNATKFEAGKQYLYNITINKTGLTVTSSIVDWLPGNGNGDNGSAE